MATSKLMPKSKDPRARKPYTVRYWLDGPTGKSSISKQISFEKKGEAEAWRDRFNHDQRAGTFIDPGEGIIRFTDYGMRALQRHCQTPGTASSYQGILKTRIAPWAGDRTLAHVASDREGVDELVNVTMIKDGLGRERRKKTLSVIKIICDEAVLDGKLPKHRILSIRVSGEYERPARSDDDDEAESLSGFVPTTYDQVAKLAEKCGHPIAVWLMRGCGLRIQEALGVRGKDFTEDGGILRVRRQATRNGREEAPLKHRKHGEGREVPVPPYVWEMVRDLGPGPVLPGVTSNPLKEPTVYLNYHTFQNKFQRAVESLGIGDGFTPHSLRHAFTSDALHNGIPITTVGKWLGHKNIDITYRIYGHLLPQSFDDGRKALQDAYEKWKASGEMSGEVLP